MCNNQTAHYGEVALIQWVSNSPCLEVSQKLSKVYRLECLELIAQYRLEHSDVAFLTQRSHSKAPTMAALKRSENTGNASKCRRVSIFIFLGMGILVLVFRVLDTLQVGSICWYGCCTIARG